MSSWKQLLIYYSFCFSPRSHRVQLPLLPQSHPRSLRGGHLFACVRLTGQQPERPEVRRAERKCCLEAQRQVAAPPGTRRYHQNAQNSPFTPPLSVGSLPYWMNELVVNQWEELNSAELFLSNITSKLTLAKKKRWLHWNFVYLLWPVYAENLLLL